jgi:hypothetical protein
MWKAPVYTGAFSLLYIKIPSLPGLQGLCPWALKDLSVSKYLTTELKEIPRIFAVYFLLEISNSFNNVLVSAL